MLIELVLDPELDQRSDHLVVDDVFAPVLLIPESLNALKKQVSPRLLSPQRAAVAMRSIHTAPFDVVSTHVLTQHI